MTPDLYRTAFNESTTRIAELAGEDDEVVIPHIPNWTARNVIIHVGLVFSFVDQSIRQGAPVGQQGVAGWANDPANQPDASDLSPWFQSVGIASNASVASNASRSRARGGWKNSGRGSGRSRAGAFLRWCAEAARGERADGESASDRGRESTID